MTYMLCRWQLTHPAAMYPTPKPATHPRLIQVEYKHAPNKQPSRVLKKQWQTKIKTNEDGW